MTLSIKFQGNALTRQKTNGNLKKLLGNSNEASPVAEVELKRYETILRKNFTPVILGVTI